jgi:hypothetical protein
LVGNKPLKKKKNLPPKNKISYDFTCGLSPAKNLKSSFSLPLQGEAGGRGVGGITPAEPVNGVGSDIFKYTPLIGAQLALISRNIVRTV